MAELARARPSASRPKLRHKGSAPKARYGAGPRRREQQMVVHGATRWLRSLTHRSRTPCAACQRSPTSCSSASGRQAPRSSAPTPPRRQAIPRGPFARLAYRRRRSGAPARCLRFRNRLSYIRYEAASLRAHARRDRDVGARRSAQGGPCARDRDPHRPARQTFRE